MLYTHIMSEAPGDVIFTGSGKPKDFSRRDFLKVAGTTGAAVVVTLSTGGCAAPGVDFTPLQVEATRQAMLPEGQRIVDNLPPWTLSGITRLTIEQLQNNSGAVDTLGGSGQIYCETKNHIVILTAEHVGKGILWGDVTFDFPFGYQRKAIHVDATIGAPGGKAPTDNDWWIEEISKPSNVEAGQLRPIRYIIVRKPKDDENFVVRPEYSVLAPPKETLNKGDIYYAGGFPGETNHDLTFTELKFLKETKNTEKSGEVKLFQFEGFTAKGMSGAAVTNSRGEVAGLLSSLNSNLTNIIPFKNYLQFQEIFSVINK